jgi:Rod binding domain-containing protein
MNAIVSTSERSESAVIPKPRLVQAAHEFEAQLMKELLKPMTAGATIDGDESDAGSGGVMADFATEALGQSLSRQGGLGIATNILHCLSRNDNDSQHSPHPGRETTISSQKTAALSSEVEYCR